MSHETTISSITPSQPRRRKTHSFAFWRRLGLCWFMSLTLIVQSTMPPVTKAEVRPPAAAPVSSAPAPPPAAAQGNVDLSVTTLDTTTIVTDSQTLMISGALGATIKNLGSDATATQFRVLAFEDRNANGQFNAGTDGQLGSVNVSDSIAAGASANLNLALSGTVTFKGNLIYVFVDSENAIAELNETNNILNTGQSSNNALPGLLNPVVEWAKESFSVLPSSSNAYSAAVADISGDGIPDIVLSTFPSNNTWYSGNLRAISGNGGAELWTVTNPAHLVNGGGSISVGDIDSDGRPEIIAVAEGAGYFDGYHLIAFEHDGTFKWKTPRLEYINCGGASIADLDKDGAPEIIVGATVLNNNGTIRWQGNEGHGVKQFGALSIVVDLDLDGTLEVLAGRTAYRLDGSVMWNAAVADGFDAAGNFDADPSPEVVVVADGKIYLLEHTGAIKWGPVVLPGGGTGGAPTVADLDNDGQPEIGVAGASNYVALETDGTIKWTQPTQDQTSNATGSSVFDFQGDGSAEVVYADELKLRIYRGVDGQVLYELPVGSGTAFELPIIADVDNDNRAEIVVTANEYLNFGNKKGIIVIGGGDGNWVNTRRIWNQHSYHITNVNEDGTIPRNEQPNWLTPGLNNFRLNTFAPGDSGANIPDLTASFIRKNDANYPVSAELTARIGNGGGAFVAPGVRVSFYLGDPAAGGTLIGTTQTAISLNPGQYEDVKVVWNNPPTGLHPITVVADDNGSGQGTVTEGNEANNKAMANIALGIGPFTLVDDLIARFKDSAVDLRWSPIAGAVGYNVYRRTGNGAPQLIKQAHPRASYADSTLTNGTTYYYTVRWLNASGIESGDGTEMSATPTAQANRDDVPPTILSAPVTRTFANQPYSYDVNARDPNAADALSYALPTPALQALAGMTVNPANGLIEWTSGFANAGYQNVTVRVEDSRGRFATQTFRLFVEIPNSPPVVNAGADQTVILAAGSTLTGAVLDDGLPFGSTLTTAWSKVSGPGTVTFANPGTAATTAAFSTPGSYVLRLTASDSQFSRNDEVTVYVVNQLASRIYTLNADFDEGNLSNVEHRIANQLQLAERNIEAAESGPGSCPSSTWPAEGNANDTSGVNNGTLKDGATFAPGYTGQAFSLDGSSAYVEVPINTPAFNFPVSFTWEAWINPTSLANNPVVFSKEDGINNRAGLQILPDGSLCSFTNSGFCAAISAPGLISTCAFTKVTLLYDGSTNNLATYVNGSQVSSATVAATYNNSAPFNIGWSPFGLGNTHFPGRIDEVSFSSCMVPPTPSQSFVTGSCNTGSPDSGTWTVVFDSQIANAEWGRLGWNAQVCGDGALTVTAASSTDNTNFSSPQTVTRGIDLTVPDGRYLRISVSFRRASTGESPILYDLSVGTDGYTPPVQTNTPPVVNAGTDLTTALFIPLRLKGSACDDGLPSGTLSFTWSKVSGPGTVAFANANALATTAMINTPGGYVLRLTASDGPSTVSDEINVTIEGTNSPPVITSTAPTSTCSNRPYSYQIIATDPNFGDVLTYSLPTAPTGMTINSTTGLIQWTPTAAQAGNHNVTVRVVDLGNNQVEQNFTVNVAATPATNNAPGITSTAPTAGVVGLLYTYQAAATDPDPCETLTWSLDVAPAGMTINAATGLIQWTPSAAQTGNQNVTVRARDFSGASATQSFTINVVASLQPPTVAISAPVPGSTVTQLVNIVGTVGDPNGASGPPVTWQVELRREGSSTYKTIGSGTGPVTNGTLAPFDPTMLANDVYYVRLSAEKGFEYREVEAPYSVIGDLKLGNFTISFTDLTIPVAGIPIAITRSYDSLDTSTGEFGAGWRLGLAGNVRDTASEVNMETFRVGTRVYVTRPDGKRVGFTFAPYRATPWFPGLLPAFTPDHGVYDTLEVAQDLLINAGDGSVLDILGGTYNPDRYFLKTKENVTYEIDEIEGLKKVTDINGNTLTVTPTGITSSTGVSVAFERDAQNRITKITEPTSTPTDPRELKYSYDANGNLAQFLDQTNNATKYSYGYAQFPNYLTRIEDPLNRAIARNVFDNQGRLIGVCDANGDPATLNGCVKLNPNAASSLQTIFNARGFRTDLILDDRGNVLTERRFLNGVNFLDTVRTYDANNNMLTETDPVGNTKSFTYDARGNTLTTTDPGNRTTTYTYNTTCNKVATVTDPASNVTAYEYDDKCNLRFVREPLNRTTEYRYNAQGQRTEMIQPIGGSWVWAYDGNGFLQSLTDPFGKATQFTFNGSGELLSRIDRNNRRIDFEYDAAHRITKEKWDTTPQRVTTYSYNATGQLTSAVDPDSSLAIGYLNTGQVQSVDNAGTPGAPHVLINYSYDANGNVTRVQDSLGGSTDYSYDGLDRLSRVTQSGTGVNEKRVDMVYDNASFLRELRRFSDLAGTQGVANTFYDYDCGGCAGRVTSIHHRKASNNAVIHDMDFTRDTLGNIVTATDAEGTHTYTYDALRQLRTAMHSQTAIQPNENYSYDAAGNRLTSHLSGSYAYSYQNGGNGSRLLQDAQINYQYDDEGNLILKTDSTMGIFTEFIYDHRNRLTRIIEKNSNGVEIRRDEYLYDPPGRRISAVEGGQQSYFIYDEQHPILRINGAATVISRRLYSQSLDKVLADELGGTSRWFLVDHLGTIRDLISNSATVLTHYSYDSFGTLSNSPNQSAFNDLLFTGREFNQQTGLGYYRARFYATSLGRFLQEDPIEPFQYGYAAANPLSFLDPSGRSVLGDYAITVKNFVVKQVASVRTLGCLIARNFKAISFWIFAIYTGEAPPELPPPPPPKVIECVLDPKKKP